MANIRARQPYARRPAPLGPLKPFLDTEFANIQRAVPVPLVRAVFAHTAVQATDDTIEVDASAGAVTVSLIPPDRLQFLRVTVIRTDDSANTVTVSGAIAGTASITLRNVGDFVTVQSNGSSWVVLGRPDDTFFDVTRFGAVGDGVTDDQPAFQAAHDAAAAAGGGRIFIPATGASYLFGSTLSVTAPNVAFEGGAWASIIKPSSASFNVITLGSAAHRSQFSRLWIQGAATDSSTTQHGIFTGALAAPDDVSVFGCLFGATSTAGGSLANAIKIDGGNRWKVHDCTVMNLQGADSNHGYGVLGGTTHYLSALGNHFLGATGHGRHCVYLSGGCTWCNVGSNIAVGFTEEAFPMYARGAQSSNTDNLIHDNQIFGGGQLTSTSAAISIFGKALRNTIRGNKVYGYLGYGITINNSAEGVAAETDSNVIADNEVTGVSWTGIALLGTSRTVLRGNTVRDASQASSGTYAGFYIIADDTTESVDTIMAGGNIATGSDLRCGLLVGAGCTGTRLGHEYFPEGQVARIITNGALVRGGQFVDYGLHGISADNGDTSQTIIVGRDALTERWATNLTAARTVTLDTTGALDGSKFKVIRTGLGAFTLTVSPLVGGASSRVIPSATAAIVDVEYSVDIGGWVLTGYSTL